MSKNAVRTVCEPAYAAIGDRASIVDTLVGLRFWEVARSRVSAKRVVSVDGVGNVVVAKRKTRLGSSRTIVTVNGKTVETEEFKKAVKSGRLRKYYGRGAK